MTKWQKNKRRGVPGDHTQAARMPKPAGPETAVTQPGRPCPLTRDRRRRMLYRAIPFSLRRPAVRPGAVVCADAEATVPFIDVARGLAYDEPVRGGMTMKLMPFLVGSLVAAGCAAVEPFDAPYALVEVGPISAARKELPVIVNAIDGDYLLNPRSGPIKPGKHLLEVQFSTQDGPYWKRKKMV